MKPVDRTEEGGKKALKQAMVNAVKEVPGAFVSTFIKGKPLPRRFQKARHQLKRIYADVARRQGR